MTPSIEKETITKDIEAEPVCQEVQERWNDSALVKRFKRKADFILLPILT
ncbi:hypothetical protein ABEF95_000030, partial [Exophiala dermatitidis]